MRRKLGWILAVGLALLGIALLLGALLQPARTLFRRQVNARTYDFIVAERGSLFFTRQGVNAPAGTEGDASRFGQYTFTAKSSPTPVTINAKSVTIQGSTITMTADPIRANVKHGFLWMNMDAMGLAPMGKPMQMTCRVAGAPMWALGVPLLLPLTVMVFRNRRRVRRQRAGLCIHCGYDLRASPDRCPECGLIAPSVTPS
jgi:hypothetical protein